MESRFIFSIAYYSRHFWASDGKRKKGRTIQSLPQENIWYNYDPGTLMKKNGFGAIESGFRFLL